VALLHSIPRSATVSASGEKAKVGDAAAALLGLTVPVITTHFEPSFLGLHGIL